jgi:hypothetical protein
MVERASSDAFSLPHAWIIGQKRGPVGGSSIPVGIGSFTPGHGWPASGNNCGGRRGPPRGGMGQGDKAIRLRRMSSREDLPHGRSHG